MIRRAYAITCPHCGGDFKKDGWPHTGVIALADDTAEDGPSFQLNALYKNLLKKLFKGDISDIDEPTMLNNVQTYMDGVFEGFGGAFAAFEYASPDYRKLAALERNVYQFSGAKNYHQLRALTDLVKDSASYTDFRNKAIPVLDEYQGNWLHTEYKAAIAGAQMASKWVDYEKHPDSMLEYRTVEDDRVRPEHQELDRITRPVDDPFWKTYYPPNGWNCRCTAIRTNGDTPTPADKLSYPDIPKMFQVNLGQQGLVFPKDHPYFIGLPKEVKQQVNALIPDHPKPH